jgi:hypothetical protein
MPIRTLNGIVAIRKETAENTYTPTASGDCIYASDISYEILEGAATARTELRGNFNKLDPVPGVAGGSIKFKVPLRGAGIAGVPPIFGTALLACGFSQTIVSGVSVTYAAISAPYDGSTGAGLVNPGPSYSLDFFEDGVVYSTAGSWGTVEFDLADGKPMYASFSFQGTYIAPVNKAIPTSGLPADGSMPPTFLGAGLTIPSWIGASASTSTPIFTELKYNLGNKLALRRDANSAAGIRGAIITDREITGSVDPEMLLPGTSDLFQAWRNGAAGAISTGVVGSTAGNRVQVLAPRCVYNKLAPANRDGIRTLGLDFQVTSVAGDADGSAFQIKFS